MPIDGHVCVALWKLSVSSSMAFWEGYIPFTSYTFISVIINSQAILM